MNDLLLETFKLCNFFDTVQGVFFLVYSIKFLDKYFDTTMNHNKRIKALRWTLKLLEFSTYFNDLADGS